MKETGALEGEGKRCPKVDVVAALNDHVVASRVMCYQKR